jgi:acyl-CoA thioester hydrolase
MERPSTGAPELSVPEAGTGPTTEYRFRVRYAETDRMGTFYNARALEWFEVGRGDMFRQLGLPYGDLEDAGVLLPVITAHAEYRGRATYDDELLMTTTVRMVGRVKIRFDIRIVHADTGAPVVEGYTIHAFINRDGKPVRAPREVLDVMKDGAR